jgi:hypothetical protein
VVPGGPGAVAGTVSKALELAGCNGEDSLETSKPYGQKAKHLDIIQKQDPSKKHFLLTFFVPKSARKRRHATQGDSKATKIRQKYSESGPIYMKNKQSGNQNHPKIACSAGG